MNTRILAVALFSVALAEVASASTQASKQRLDAIWDAVDDRVAHQIDVWFDDGDYPKSIHMLDFEATYSPHDYDVVTNLGWMQENIEEWDAALNTYKTYWKNNPNDRDRALPEAQYLFGRKRYAEIPSLVEPVLNLKPHPNNYRILAHSYEKLKKLQDARRVWNLLIAIDPKDDTAKKNLSRVEKKIQAGK